MKVFDFNIHLPTQINNNVNDTISLDLSMKEPELLNGLNFHRDFIRGLNGINILLFNTSLFESKLHNFNEEVGRSVERASYTALIDFRRLDIDDYIDKLAKNGVRCVMVNSYLQKILESDFHLVLKACQLAAEKGLIICIDGSYGTSKMFTFDNVKLMCYVSDNIVTSPIVIIHSGGKRILEVMLLAMEKTNIWLDTSFSLPFYKDSSIEADYAFAYKKIGLNRILYGSDLPYLNSENAFEIHKDFFEKHKFSDNEIEQIFYYNALNLLSY